LLYRTKAKIVAAIPPAAAVRPMYIVSCRRVTSDERGPRGIDEVLRVDKGINMISMHLDSGCVRATHGSRATRVIVVQRFGTGPSLTLTLIGTGRPSRRAYTSGWTSCLCVTVPPRVFSSALQPPAGSAFVLPTCWARSKSDFVATNTLGM
jgi:hypothetical protein